MENKKPNISYFKVFGSKCFILNTKDNLGKFDAKSNVGIFFGYSSSSKAYRVFNKKTMVVEESVHVVFDESNESLERRESVNDDVGLDFSMEDCKLMIKFINEEGRLIQRRKNHLFPILHLLNLSKENLVKNFQRMEICHKSSTRSNYR